MSCNRCGKGGKLCPLSFGLALGLTCFLTAVLYTLWVVYEGPTRMMTMLNIPVFTMSEGMICAGWCLLKGFVFGFVLILLYDLFACCMARCCCKRCNCANGCKCGPGCTCGPTCKCCSTNGSRGTV